MILAGVVPIPIYAVYYVIRYGKGTWREVSVDHVHVGPNVRAFFKPWIGLDSLTFHYEPIPGDMSEQKGMLESSSRLEPLILIS